jgi:rubrerythrin
VTAREAIASAWSFRARVERDAERRFERLAAEIASFDSQSPVIELMRQAARDERRHAKLCAALATEHGANEVPGSCEPASIVPRQLGPREAVLYEVVAACCVTETESVATVASLLGEDLASGVRDVLHEIARDEVSHSRMGWAHLAREAPSADPGFLAPFLPAMLSGAVDERIFSSPDDERGSDELLRHGVLPLARKREIFLGTLHEVVLPGLEQFGIDSAPALAWLAERGIRAPQRSA